MTNDDRLSAMAVTRGRLGWVLDHFRDDLVNRWAARVLADPVVASANLLTRPVLEDHIPDLIDRLLARLSWHPTRAWGERAARELGASSVGVAHARNRVAAHYSLTEALRELSHFRAALLELCHEHDVSLNLDESQLFHVTIDEMMTASASELERASLLMHEQAMAIVAHELRNPLSAIAMCAARVRRATAEDMAPITEVLTRNANLMERLVSDLLTISKMEAGHFSIHAARADARDFIRQTHEQFRPLAETKTIELVALVPSEPALIVCDRDRILQALGNLVANAIKFTPPGGRVRIELERKAQECIFRVADNGPGVPAEFVSEIFRPFWQAPATSRQGTGLGLAIVRGIVEAHRGQIALEAGAGTGATFAFTLPQDSLLEFEAAPATPS